MAPVARELASSWGALEPLQTAASLEGQVQELKMTLESYAAPPVKLIGFSWGAWLSYLLAARYPALVEKLILVGSGPFDEKYAGAILDTRLGRLEEGERSEAESLISALSNTSTGDEESTFVRLSELLSKTDSYDPLPCVSESMDYNVSLFRAVWPEAAELRRSGRLLEYGSKIRCSVVAIHGDYDPHPIEGVREPLARVLKDFRFIALSNCGHRPWLERKARKRFYEVLKEELVGPVS